MSEIEVVFVGGPADGERRVVETAKDGSPRRTFTVHTQHEGAFEYVCQPSQLDEGPLWVYVPASPSQEPPPPPPRDERTEG